MPKRILVIDDTPEIVELYRDLLSGEGYDVVTSLQPLEDPGDVELIQPDLIILDWLFGRIAMGMETITRLADHPPTASIPVIVCTAAAKSLGPVESILVELGIQVIHKPFNLDELLSAVKHGLTTFSSTNKEAS